MSKENYNEQFFDFFTSPKNTSHDIKLPQEISEQKFIAETFRILERAVEQSIDGIAVANMDGIIRFCNQSWAQMHGYCVCELIGKHLNIFHTKEQVEKDVIHFNEIVKKKGYHQGEVGHVRKDGMVFDTWMTTTMLKDEKGKPIGFIGIARDITEQQQTKEALIASENKYRKLFENSIEGIGISQGNRVVAANRALLDIFGYENIEDFIKVPLLDHVMPEYREFIRERMKKREMNEPVAPRFEYKIICKNGEIRDMEISSSEISIAGEKYVQSTFRDITHQKRMESRLVKITSVMLNFGPDPNQNINSLVALCGEILEASCALYNRLEKGMLCSLGQWNVPADYNPIDGPDGHICYDVIKHGGSQLFVVRNLFQSQYAKTDPNVVKYNLQTYVGLPIKFNESYVGSLCVVYARDFIPDRDDEKFMQIIASAIAVEEKRRYSENSLKESEQRWRLLVENIPESIITVDQNGKILALNRTVKGLTMEKVLGMSVYEYVSSEYHEIVRRSLERVFNTGKPDVYEVLGFGPNGPASSWYVTRAVPIERDNKIIGATLISTDITERRKVEKQQISLTSDLRAVVEATDELLSCSDIEAIFRRAVEFAREKFGLERCAIFIEENGLVRGIYGTDRYGRTTDEHSLRFEKNEIWKRRLKKLDPRDPSWMVVREPQLEWDGKSSIQIGEGWIVITPIQSAHRPIGVFVNDTAISGSTLEPMKQDTLAVFCSLIGNIIERKRAEQRLEIVNKRLLQTGSRFKQLALKDSHTGLFNHRYLVEIIEPEFNRAKRYGFALSLIMLDLDYFKSVNDVYGHQFGDLILKQFARYLKKTVRHYDILVRFGGEEFVIISPGIDRETALVLSQKILNSIYLRSFGNEEHSVKLKLSIAVASYPEDNVNCGMDLVNLADKILNKAKEDGGERVYCFQDTTKGKLEIMQAASEHDNIHFLQEKLDKLTKRANQSLIESIFAFAKAIKLKDNYTGEHVENTVYFASEIAKKLNLPENRIEEVRQAAQLHDLGKIGISDKILLKKSKLTKVEFEEIKKHPMIAVDILRPIQFLQNIIPLILYHHERWDGNGYPFGLKQDEIPMGARIVAISDVYQALISDRPYRRAFNKTQAIKLIKGGSGTQFDPKIVETFSSLV